MYNHTAAVAAAAASPAATELTPESQQLLQRLQSAMEQQMLEEQLQQQLEQQAQSVVAQICKPPSNIGSVMWGAMMMIALSNQFHYSLADPRLLAVSTYELSTLVTATGTDILPHNHGLQQQVVADMLSQQVHELQQWLVSNAQQHPELVAAVYRQFWPVHSADEIYNQVMQAMVADPLFHMSSSDGKWSCRGESVIASVRSLGLENGNGVVQLRPAAWLFLSLVRMKLQSMHEKLCHKSKVLPLLCSQWMVYRSSPAVALCLDVLHRLTSSDVDSIQWKVHMQSLLERIWRMFFASLLQQTQLPAVCDPPIALSEAESTKVYYIACWAVRKAMQKVHKKEEWSREMHDALNSLVLHGSERDQFRITAPIAQFCTMVDEGGLIYVKTPVYLFFAQLDWGIRGSFTDLRKVGSSTFKHIRDRVQRDEALRALFREKCTACGVAASDDVLGQLYDMLTKKWLNMRSNELRVVYNDKVVAWRDLHKDSLRGVLKNLHGMEDNAAGPSMESLLQLGSDDMVHAYLVANICTDGGQYLMSKKFTKSCLRELCDLYRVDPQPASSATKADIVESLVAAMCAVNAVVPAGLIQVIERPETLRNR